jgi:hypothetical protein
VRIHSKFDNGWMFAEKRDGSKGVCPIDFTTEVKAGKFYFSYYFPSVN